MKELIEEKKMKKLKKPIMSRKKKVQTEEEKKRKAEYSLIYRRKVISHMLNLRQSEQNKKKIIELSYTELNSKVESKMTKPSKKQSNRNSAAKYKLKKQEQRNAVKEKNQILFAQRINLQIYCKDLQKKYKTLNEVIYCSKCFYQMSQSSYNQIYQESAHIPNPIQQLDRDEIQHQQIRREEQAKEDYPRDSLGRRRRAKNGKGMSKQEKALKNKIAARKSRQRSKQSVKKLEIQIKELTQNIKYLRSKINTFEKDIKRLKVNKFYCTRCFFSLNQREYFINLGSEDGIGVQKTKKQVEFITQNGTGLATQKNQFDFQRQNKPENRPFLSKICQIMLLICCCLCIVQTNNCQKKSINEKDKSNLVQMPHQNNETPEKTIPIGQNSIYVWTLDEKLQFNYFELVIDHANQVPNLSPTFIFWKIITERLRTNLLISKMSLQIKVQMSKILPHLHIQIE